MRRIAAGLVLGCLAWVASASNAHADDKTSAQYFGDGLKLMSEGESHYAEACVAFEHALALNGGAGTKFNLADCYEKTRRPASALSLFRQVEDITRQAGQQERSDAAKTRGDVVEKRTPNVTVHAPWLAQHPDATFTLDGKPLVKAALEAPIPLDFGKHQVVAHVGASESEASADLETDAQAALLNVQMPITASAAADPADPARQPVTPPPQEQADNAGAVNHTQRNVGWIVGGVGIAAVVVGTILAESAKSDYDSLTSKCKPANNCTDSVASAANSDRNKANVDGVIDIVGLAAIATGAVLWITAPSDTKTGSLRLAPSIGLNHGGFAASGTF